MATTDVNAPKARRTGVRGFFASLFARISDFRARWAAENRALARARAAHHAAVLSAMTDEQLEGWGIKRENIHAHAFRNIPKA